MTNQTSSNNNTRIAKNTYLLYFRMLFMMVVSLYTSRVILNTLGVEDFSISENNESLLLNCRAKKMYEIVNKQVKFLTSQYIGTYKSAYTKGYALN